MKRCQSLLICVLVMFDASAEGLDVATPPHHASFAAGPAVAADSSAPAEMSAGALRSPRTTQANFSSFGTNVVKDVRATSAFVQEQAVKAGTPSGWLTTLAALGLIAFQLRRKHRSLPQRRIAPYG